jgi:hypothetical protein
LGGREHEPAARKHFGDFPTPAALEPEELQGVAFAVVEEEKFIDVRVAFELGAAELDESLLAESHADGLLVQVDVEPGWVRVALTAP